MALLRSAGSTTRGAGARARIAGGAFVVAALACLALDARAGSLGAGDALPSFHLPDRSGRMVSPASLSARVVIIDFWASWCALCGEGLPALDALAARYPDKLQVIAINIDHSRARADEFLAKHIPKPRFTVLYDPDASTPSRFGTEAMPTLYLVVDGVIRRVEEGYEPDEMKELEQTVADAAGHAGNAAPARRPSNPAQPDNRPHDRSPRMN